MAIAGLAVTVLGFIISVASLTLSASAEGRLGIVLAGLAISLFGIIGLVNRAYLKNPIWKK
ncbi:MAG: hypothetical protein ABI759_28090 [Candidatus Solibacter sp.]